MKDLNEILCTQTEEGIPFVPSIVLTEARDINEDGIICGWGNVRGSDGRQTRGFLLIPMDPNDCEVGDEGDDGGSGGGSGTSSSGGGTGFEGTPIIGTPGNLADGSGDDSNAPGSAPQPSALTALCGSGSAALLPLMLLGLCRAKVNAKRGFRRTR